MNRLKTEFNAAGQPIELDDLRWIENGVKEAFEAVFAAYGQDRFIISGCEIEYNPVTHYYDCTEGFIYYNGEILYCAGGSAYQDESHTPVFELDVSYDPAGYEECGDGNSYDTYEIRAALYHEIDPAQTSGKLIAMTAKRLPQLIQERLNELEEDWVYPSLEGDWETQTSGIYSSVCYKKDTNGNVWFRGQAYSGTGLLFTLPVGYRPQVAEYRVSVYPSDESITKFTINPNGQVSALGAATKINFDGHLLKLN